MQPLDKTLTLLGQKKRVANDTLLGQRETEIQIMAIAEGIKLSTNHTFELQKHKQLALKVICKSLRKCPQPDDP